MSPVALPPDRRFRRAHVKPARTRRHWQALVGRSVRYTLIVAVLLYAAYRVPRIVVQTGKLPEHESPGSTGLVLAHENVTLALGKVPAVVMLKPRELAVPVTATVTGAGVVL